MLIDFYLESNGNLVYMNDYRMSGDKFRSKSHFYNFQCDIEDKVIKSLESKSLDAILLRSNDDKKLLSLSFLSKNKETETLEEIFTGFYSYSNYKRIVNNSYLRINVPSSQSLSLSEIKEGFLTFVDYFDFNKLIDKSMMIKKDESFCLEIVKDENLINSFKDVEKYPLNSLLNKTESVDLNQVISSKIHCVDKMIDYLNKTVVDNVDFNYLEKSILSVSPNSLKQVKTNVKSKKGLYSPFKFTILGNLIMPDFDNECYVDTDLKKERRKLNKGIKNLLETIFKSIIKQQTPSKRLKSNIGLIDNLTELKTIYSSLV